MRIRDKTIRANCTISFAHPPYTILNAVKDPDVVFKLQDLFDTGGDICLGNSQSQRAVNLIWHVKERQDILRYVKGKNLVVGGMCFRWRHLEIFTGQDIIADFCLFKKVK